jgi:DNA mismatch repair protein MutH
MTARAVHPPASEEELLARARALEGRSLAELAARLGAPLEAGLHGKGKPGALVERALGATGGPQAEVDFPGLGIELKTVPVGERGAPRESTYVCRIQLLEADAEEWETSWVRRKLARVLFVPLLGEGAALVVGRAVPWSPTPEEDAALRADFDEIMGALATGGVEGLTAHVGVHLQVRPKAAHGAVRTAALGKDGETIATVPRGFYLRASFTGAILSGRSPLRAIAR